MSPTHEFEPKVVVDPAIELATTAQFEPVEPVDSARDESWLGIAMAPPQVGAAIVISTRNSNEFVVTSLVAKLIERVDGVLVQTVTRSRYFVAHDGDVYRVRTC